MLEELGKLSFMWLNKHHLAGDSITKAMVCEKTRKLPSHLLQENSSTSATGDEFKGSLVHSAREVATRV